MNQHPDRRVRRTRDMLNRAFLDLLREKDYDSITVQDVVDRAGVGRATFYLHFSSKDELFISSHTRDIPDFKYDLLTRDELLADTSPPSLVALMRYLAENRALYHAFRRSKEAIVLTEHIRRRVVQVLEDSLRAAFSEADSGVPFHLLANYIAGAQIACMMWWAESHTDYTPDTVADMMHRLQRAAICDALRL